MGVYIEICKKISMHSSSQSTGVNSRLGRYLRFLLLVYLSSLQVCINKPLQLLVAASLHHRARQHERSRAKPFLVVYSNSFVKLQHNFSLCTSWKTPKPPSLPNAFFNFFSWSWRVTVSNTYSSTFCSFLRLQECGGLGISASISRIMQLSGIDNEHENSHVGTMAW